MTTQKSILNYFDFDLRVLLIITGLVGGEHAPGKASGTKKTKHGQLHPLSRVKELTNYTREWLSDNLVRFQDTIRDPGPKLGNLVVLRSPDRLNSTNLELARIRAA